MIKPGMSIAEKVKVKASQAWKDHMNSSAVLEEHDKLGPRLRKYKDKRRELHEKHKGY